MRITLWFVIILAIGHYGLWSQGRPGLDHVIMGIVSFVVCLSQDVTEVAQRLK